MACRSGGLWTQKSTQRESALVTAYETVAHRFNELGLAEAQDPTTRPYHSRPFITVCADRFVRSLLACLGDTTLSDLRPAACPALT